uniref:separase n=1 Tax=Seriola dumerili TaxID=41447 RepID=A0A3B4TT27_SERDU
MRLKTKSNLPLTDVSPTAANMKCLKVDEYVKRIASVEETEHLLQELEVSLQGRTLCDRVIRACNHQLGVGSLDFDHVSQLVKLVELSLNGYDISAALVPQSSPLYMEKIIFHIVKKLSSLEAHILCSYVSGLLYSRLTTAQQAEDYYVLLRSCFSVLWTGLSAAKDRKILNPRDKFHCQMQALSFLLLLDTESATTSFSKAPIYTEDAIAEFESSCGAVTNEDASFLLQEVRSLFNKCQTGGQGLEGDEARQCIEKSSVYVRSEMLLIIVKVLCKAGHYDLASTFLNETEIIAVSNLVCGLYNRRLYDQAFTLVEILCRDLCKNCPVSLSVDRLSRPFMLAVQTSRRAGQLERALDWVILWLKALGDNVPTHMAEPVSLWVKTKTDAARNSEEDIRLRTLRDGFGPDVPDEGVMLCLLEEELRAYKEVAGDTAQERYNTLCDLLDICHEGSSHTHLRAVYLCEMAQVVCFQDFSEQTDCSAVDFTHEALRLLEEERETAENADRLKDDKAHALLWLYICTLEKNLQEAIEKDKKLRELREQTRCVANPIGTNDFDYEDKQKTQDNIMVYEGLHFNLAAENKLCKPLERALDEWSALLQSQVLPSVRNPKQTCSSIALTAALFRLMGKPLKALEAYRLAIGLSHHLADSHSRASFLCQSTSLLLDIGAPDLALVMHFIFIYLFIYFLNDYSWYLAEYIYIHRIYSVDRGVPYLCEVLKEVNEQRQSKSWYLLRARALQTCSAYLSLDTDALPQAERSINSPDIALYESLKLLCSLLVTLVGKGLYGTNSSSSDVRFIDQGDNLVLKWQLLSDLLNCSMKMVAVRSSCGAINDARLQCLEALKLAIKLQALSQCAELLVMKAELELMQGEREESRLDLDKVRNLLELCTGQLHTRLPIQIALGTYSMYRSVSSLKLYSDEVVISPPLKAQPRRWLSSLAHESNCQCPCCSEPCLGRATARWAATQAELVLQLDPNEAKAGLKLQWATLARCKSVTAKLGAKLAKLFPPCGPTKGSSKPSLMQDLVGRVYLCMALSGLEPRLNKVCGIWKVLEAGLAFVDSTPSPVLRPVRAGLMATKAIVSLITLASKQGCNPEDLFSNAWTWNTPKEDKELKSEQKMVSSSSLLKKSKDSIKNPDIPNKTKEAKKVKAVKPKIEVTSSSRGKGLVPMTPVMKAPRTASKLQFHVYEELSPVQDKAQPVPAAPRRTKKSRFKVAEKVLPKRQAKGKSTAVPRTTSSEDEKSLVCQPPSTRRGRTRRELSRAEAETLEEPDKMRTIEEEINEVLDISIEQLRTSDTETEDNPASSKYTGVYFVYMEDFLIITLCTVNHQLLIQFHQYYYYLFIHLFILFFSDNLSLEDVQLLLRSAWLALQHFPSPTIYPTLSTLLALALGQHDPITTAMLHAQSLGITSRHRTIRHLESVNFHYILSLCFAGVTVCVMSVLGVKPGEMGNSIILTRLEKGSDPVTVHIPTSKQQVMHPISWLVQEMDSIQVEQKVVSCVSEKAKWWEGRRALDSRVEQLLKDMEELLGCWKSFLLPFSSDPELSNQAQRLCKALSARGVMCSEEMLKVCVCVCVCVFLFLFLFCLVFFSFFYLFYFLWILEHCVSILKSRSVSRMPSLHSLIGLSIQKETDSHSILKQGVDTKKVFYVLDPDANLGNSQDRFKEWFSSKLDWEGVCGVAPDSGQLEEAVATKDLYIYVGHGAGARFLDSQVVLKRQMKAASLLFGCSSAALAVRGDQEGQGIILSYLIAGCPFVLGNLWDVTDRDIDRFTKALLESWLSAGSGAPLLDYMGPSRQATHLKHLIGAAPVVYGLPVHLQ